MCILEQQTVVAYLDNLQAELDTLRQMQSEAAAELGSAAALRARQGVYGILVDEIKLSFSSPAAPPKYIVGAGEPFG